MADIFANNASKLVVLAALDGYLDVLKKEARKAENLKLLVRQPPRNYKPSDLLKNDGSVEHVKSVLDALTRKTTSGGTVDGKSYRGLRTATLRLDSDVSTHVFNDENVPGDYKAADVMGVTGVVLANGTKLSEQPMGNLGAGKFRFSSSTSTLTFNANDNTAGASIEFVYEVDHDQDASLRHIKEELAEHVAEANLADDPS